MHRSWALLLASLLLIPSPVNAQPDELAKGHYMAGQAYYNQARYTEAIREFEEAYRLSPKPALLYNIAQAWERMGNIEKALDYLKRFLKVAPEDKRPTVEERIRNLEARLRQTGIVVRSNVEGATVQVDGKEVGKTPLPEPIRVAPGSHQIRVSRDGLEPFSAFVSVTAGNLVEVNPVLAGRIEQPAGPTEPVRHRRRGYTWTWVTAGTSAALLITCGITGGLALKKANDAGPKPNQDAAKADSARTLALISDVTLGVGLAAAAAATILFFYERKLNREQAAVVAPWVGPRSAGLGAAWTF